MSYVPVYPTVLPSVAPPPPYSSIAPPSQSSYIRPPPYNPHYSPLPVSTLSPAAATWAILKIFTGAGVLGASLYIAYRAVNDRADVEERIDDEQVDADDALGIIRRIFSPQRQIITPAVTLMLRRTLLYLCGGVAVTALSAALCAQLPRSTLFALPIQMTAAIVTAIGALGVSALPKRYVLTKHVAFVVCHAGFGAALALITFIPHNVVISALAGTAVTVTACSALALASSTRSSMIIYAPFVLGAAMIATSGIVDGVQLLSAPNTALRLLPIATQLRLFGWIAVFGGYLIFDLQKLIILAEFAERRRTADTQRPRQNVRRNWGGGVVGHRSEENNNHEDSQDDDNDDDNNDDVNRIRRRSARLPRRTERQQTVNTDERKDNNDLHSRRRGFEETDKTSKPTPTRTAPANRSTISSTTITSSSTSARPSAPEPNSADIARNTISDRIRWNLADQSEPDYMSMSLDLYLDMVNIFFEIVRAYIRHNEE